MLSSSVPIASRALYFARTFASRAGRGPRRKGGGPPRRKAPTTQVGHANNRNNGSRHTAQVRSGRRDDGHRFDEIRLIDLNGENVGVVDFDLAKARACSEDVKLVPVSLSASPPVFKMRTTGQIREQQAKEKERKKASKPKPTKSVNFTCKIASGDRATKVRRIEGFLGKGHSVTIQVRFRRFVNWKNKERNDAQIHNDNIVLNEAVAVLESVLSEVEAYGKAHTQSKSLRDVKAMLQPLRSSPKGKEGA
eukprot:g1210.t1